MTKDQMMEELKRRVEILEWMKDNNIRAFKDVARVVASYAETPGEFMEKIRKEKRDAAAQQEAPATEVPPIENTTTGNSAQETTAEPQATENLGVSIDESAASIEESPEQELKKKSLLRFKRKE